MDFLLTSLPSCTSSLLPNLHLLFQTEAQASAATDSIPFSVYLQFRAKGRRYAYICIDFTSSRVSDLYSFEFCTVLFYRTCYSQTDYTGVVHLSTSATDYRYPKFFEYFAWLVDHLQSHSHSPVTEISILRDTPVHYRLRLSSFTDPPGEPQVL